MVVGVGLGEVAVASAADAAAVAVAVAAAEGAVEVTAMVWIVVSLVLAIGGLETYCVCSSGGK